MKIKNFAENLYSKMIKNFNDQTSSFALLTRDDATFPEFPGITSANLRNVLLGGKSSGTASIEDFIKARAAYGFFFESWLETLKRNKFWGGHAEYTLFAYAFKCHVICLRQLKNELQVICSREFHLKISIEKDRKRFVQMGEMLQSLSDVIFIWHHKMTAPRHKLGDEKISYGDHYSFLEYKGKKTKKFYHDIFQFQHTLSLGGFVNLCSPEEGQKTVDNDVHTDAAVFGIEIPRNMENREDGADTAPTMTPVPKLKTRTSISPEDKKGRTQVLTENVNTNRFLQLHRRGC
jgi:hypothetical protein